MAAYQTQQINVGSIAAPDVGSVFANFADRINKQQSSQLENMRQAAQYDRQQVLNQRADQEWNRQQGIIQAKKDVASDFAKNQYAEMYGGKQENAGLDKQVLDYVNNGGEINEDLAKRIQGLYEQHKPFREDAAAALTQQLIGKGLSAADAEAEAKGMAGGLPSRVELQTRADAQRKAEQDYYDEVAKRNQKALDLKLDIAKANQTGDKETADIKLRQYQAMFGGGTGGSGGGSAGAPGGGYSDISNTLASIGFSDAGSALNEVDKARALKYNDQQIASAIKQSIDADPTGVLFHDKKLNTEGFWGRLSQMTPGASVGNTPLTIRDVKEPTAEEWASTVPIRAGYNVVDYKPNALLDRARQVAPELFRGDPNKIVEETKVSNPTVENKSTSGNTLADRNNNPGNLRISPRNNWQGGQEGEKGFVKFDTPELGARALAKTINNNVGMTVKGFINKYAPPSENDTGSYIDQVSKRLGKDSSSTISKDDIPELMKVIAKREGGSFTNDQLMGGYKLFLNETTKGDTSKLPEVTNVDKAYDRLSNTIEPMLPKDTKVETQEQKQALLDKYTNSSTVPNKVFQSAKKDYLESGGGTLDDIRIKSNLARDGKLSDEEAENVYEQLKNSVASDNNIAYRNYLIAKRTGSYQGKSADDWYNELDSKSKGAVWAPAASVVAGLTPAVIAAIGGGISSLLGTSAMETTDGILGRAMIDNASEKAAGLMNVLKSPKLSAGEVQQTKDSLLGLAKQYPELRTEIVKFLQNL